MLMPDYYNDFSCLADTCPDTCCKGWNIEIEPDTLEKWQADQTLAPAIAQTDGRCHIGMQHDGICPFLNEQKLCRIVIEKGDAMIPKICRDFPRQFTELGTVTQKSISLRCAPVMDLLWKKDMFQYTGSASFPAKELLDGLLAIGNLAIRNSGAISSARFLSALFEALCIIHEKLKELTPCDDNGYKEYGTEYITGENTKEVLQIFEALLSSNTIQNTEPDFQRLHELTNELFQHFSLHDVYGGEVRAYTTMSNLLPLGMFPANIRYRDTFSGETDRKVLLVILEELFTSVLSAEVADYETAILHLQWLINQYLIIRHVLFIDANLGQELDCKALAFRISRIFRMTDLPDIQKIAYFDSDFVNWMWSPLKVKDLLE